jgi:hypothetical protein
MVNLFIAGAILAGLSNWVNKTLAPSPLKVITYYSIWYGYIIMLSVISYYVSTVINLYI